MFYEIANQPGHLAKLYHSYHEEYEAKVRQMIAHPPTIAESPEGVPAMTWPLAPLYNARASFVGYSLREVRQAASFRRLLDPDDKAQRVPGQLQRELHQVAYHLASAMQSLHAAGHVAGTLLPTDILVTLPSWVTLIDTDSIQVHRQHIAETIYYRASLGEQVYLAPEFQGKDLQQVALTPEQDRFNLAVLLFRLLMRGFHPFELQWCGLGSQPPLEQRIAQGLYPYAPDPRGPVIPPRYAPRLEWLSPRLVALFERCFTEGHEAPWQRPWPVEWKEALQEAELGLIVCSGGHRYSIILPECPYCTFHFEPPKAPPKPAVVDTLAPLDGEVKIISARRSGLDPIAHAQRIDELLDRWSPGTSSPPKATIPQLIDAFLEELLPPPPPSLPSLPKQLPAPPPPAPPQGYKTSAWIGCIVYVFFGGLVILSFLLGPGH